MFSLSFDRFYDKIKQENFGELIKKLICSKTKDRIGLMDKKAYLECIRHGLHNINDKMSQVSKVSQINNIEDNQIIFFLLALSGNSDLHDIKRLYHIDYHSWYDKKIIHGAIDLLGIRK
jgi:protein tyrosine phosphatase